MPKINGRYALFDLDGTLTDPFLGITRSIAYALVSMGLPEPDLNDLKWCIGPPLSGSFEILLSTREPKVVRRAVGHYRERFSDTGLYENRLYDGIPEAVSLLRAQSIRTFVATSKPAVYARRIVEHFGLSELFDEVYGSELDGTLSDKGDLIAHILESERLLPSQGVMVGDREHDMKGALRSSISPIGVLYGYGSEQELLAAGALKLCRTPSEIANAGYEILS